MLYNFTNLIASNNTNTTGNLTTNVPIPILASDQLQVEKIVILTVGISVGLFTSCWLCFCFCYLKFKNVESITPPTIDLEAQATVEHRLTAH